MFNLFQIQKTLAAYRKVCCPVDNFRACAGISVNYVKLDNQRIPLLPVLCVQLGEKVKVSKKYHMSFELHIHESTLLIKNAIKFSLSSTIKQLNVKTKSAVLHAI